MKYRTARKVRVVLPQAALTAIFDECDRFNEDETGGRVIGYYSADPGGRLTIHVTGIIDSGSQTRRSPVSLFQDGRYQEGVFRAIERVHAEIEHLGNWHTHHVNGLHELSAGDVATYQRTVNHRLHNTSFFYALLVTSKRKSMNPLSRYRIKHYLFRRGDDHVYRIARSRIRIVNEALVWPISVKVVTGQCSPARPKAGPQHVRIDGREFVNVRYTH